MATIAFITDVHIANHRRHGGAMVAGLNQRARKSLPVLKAAIDLSLEEGAAALVVLGDLLDVHRPEPQIITAVQELFAYGKARGLRIVLMLGNHEQQSSAEGDHALGPFAPVAEVIEQPTVLDVDGVALGLIPFRVGAATSWFAKAVDDLFRDAVPFGDKGRLLGIHLGIADDDTPAFLRSAHDAIHVAQVMDAGKANNITRVFAGNWHNRARWVGESPDPDVYQIGALVPTGWDNPGMRYGGIAFWNSADESVRVDSLPGPRFLAVDSLTGLEAVATMPVALTQLYVSAKLPRDDVAAGLEVVAQLKAAEKIVAGEVLVQDVAARVAAREAAKAAGSAASLETALAGFIEKMDPGEGVARAEVLRLSSNYLEKGAAE